MPDDQHDNERTSEPFATPASWSAPDVPLARPLEIHQARPRLPDDPMLLAGISRSRAAVHVLIMLAAFAVVLMLNTAVMFVSGAAHHREGAVEIENPSVALVATMAGGLLLSAGAVALLRFAGAGPAALGLTAHKAGVDLLLAPAVALACFAVFFINSLLMPLYWPEGARQMTQNPERIAEMLPDVHVSLLCLMMIVVGLYEELLFRGFLMTHLRRLTGSWTAAVILTALPFALMHIGGDPGSQATATAIPLFFLSVLWSLVTIWRRSLVPSVIGHAAFNAIQILVLKFVIFGSPPA